MLRSAVQESVFKEVNTVR